MRGAEQPIDHPSHRATLPGGPFGRAAPQRLANSAARGVYSRVPATRGSAEALAGRLIIMLTTGADQGAGHVAAVSAPLEPFARVAATEPP